MAEFKDVKLWMKLALFFILLGFLQNLVAFAMGLGGGFAKSSIEAFLVIGFLCFLVAVILNLGTTFIDEMTGRRTIHICFIVFALIAGISTIIAVAIWADEYDNRSQKPPVYTSMIGVCSALCSILAGIFAILNIVGVNIEVRLNAQATTEPN